MRRYVEILRVQWERNALGDNIMSAGVNKAILLGNLGKDPELKFGQSGKALCTFSLATTERWNDEDHTEWHNIVLFGRLAEIASEYLRKGSRIYLEGRIQNRSYENQEGQRRYISEIVGSSMVMLGAPVKGGGDFEKRDEPGASAARARQSQAQPETTQPEKAQPEATLPEKAQPEKESPRPLESPSLWAQPEEPEDNLPTDDDLPF
jgi:single-strand DNA-binding protein